MSDGARAQKWSHVWLKMVDRAFLTIAVINQKAVDLVVCAHETTAAAKRRAARPPSSGTSPRDGMAQLEDQISNWRLWSSRDSGRDEGEHFASHTVDCPVICSFTAVTLIPLLFFAGNKGILFYRLGVKACRHSTCRDHAGLGWALNWKMLAASPQFLDLSKAARSQTFSRHRARRDRHTFGHGLCSRWDFSPSTCRPFAAELYNYPWATVVLLLSLPAQDHFKYSQMKALQIPVTYSWADRRSKGKWS